MKRFAIFYLPLIAAITFFTACDKDPVIPNEEELITTLTYTLTPSGGGETVVFSFTDIDGDGGQEPLVIAPPIQAGSIYNGVIELANESVSPAEDITSEVLDEDEEHQLFYLVTDADATIQYADMDNNGHPVGLITRMFTLAPGEGSLRILLRHLPDKTAAGVQEGQIQNAGGETDVEVVFPLVIQ